MGFLSQIKHRLPAGFTLVEVLIIAPVVIIAVTGFVMLMVGMVGDVLVTRDQNNLSFETQDSLDRIEQDVRLSTQFLTTTNSLPSPQGSDSNFTGTAAFSNAGSTLILGGLTTDKNPADSSRQLVYYALQPNACGSSQVTYNRVLLSKIVYFINNGSLWRRVILPDYNTNATPDDNTVCAVPWQRNTCSIGYSTSTRCQTNDSELLRGVGSFSIKYYDSPTGTTDIGNSQALAATTVEVTLNGSKTTAGRALTSTGTMRASKLNNIDVDPPIPAAPSVLGQFDGSAVTFSWDPVPLASSYYISYNINGGTTVNTSVNSSTKSYSINASFGDTITFFLAAHNSSGTSSYGQAAVTVSWYPCSSSTGWINYQASYAAAAYTKTNNDIVVLKGLIKNGTATSGTTICTLPPGYRPTARLAFIVPTSNGVEGAAARIDVLSTGEVQIISGNNTWIDLDNIRFVASTAPYSWADLTPAGTWTNFLGTHATLQSTVDTVGRVHIQGAIKNGSWTDGAAITTMPAAQQPSHIMTFPATSATSYNEYRANPSPTGTLTARGINAGAFYSIIGQYYPSSFGGWTTVNSLGGSWVNYNAATNTPVGYTKASDGMVTLRGTIKNGNTAAGTNLFTLPAGYQPKERQMFIVSANGAYGRIDVFNDGTVQLRAGSATFTSLDSISFLAEQ